MKFQDFTIADHHVEVVTNDAEILYIQLPLTADSQNVDEQGNDVPDDIASLASDYVKQYYAEGESGKMAMACASGFKDFTVNEQEVTHDGRTFDGYRLIEDDTGAEALIKEHDMSDYFNVYLFEIANGLDY